MALYTDILLDQGSTYSAKVPVTGVNKLPVDLSGYAVRGLIKKSYSSAAVGMFNGFVEDPENGIVSISLTPTQTSALKAGRYVYDIEIYKADESDVIRIVEGQVTVTPRVTSRVLPDDISYDVIEYDSYGELPSVGDIGKIYITLDDNRIYRWDIVSSAYIEILPPNHSSRHAIGGSDELTAADIGAAPTSHTHPASEISDSTTTGRSLMTAANASAARTTLELGNAALATTSTGGNGSADSGKVLAFGATGDIKATKVTIQSSTGLIGLILNPPASSFATPTFVAGSYQVAATQSLTGVPDNIAPPLDKTTPIDADEVVIRDSAASFVAKRLTFANLWTWILSKLGGNLTIGGTKTWSGQQEATGQSATNGTSLMTRDLGDARFFRNNLYLAPNSSATVTTANGGTVIQNYRGYTILSVPASTASALSLIFWNIIVVIGRIFTALHSFNVRQKVIATLGDVGSRRAGIETYLQFGRAMGSNTLVQLDRKGYGIKFTSNGINCFVHNGTTLNENSFIVATYNQWMIDFIPGVRADFYGRLAGSEWVLVDSITTGLPSGSGLQDSSRLEIITGDTGSGGTPAHSEHVSNVWFQYGE